MGKRIIFTGGSGKIGRHVIPYLLERGHQVLNIDRTPLDLPGVDTVITDLADAGEAYNVLTLHFGFGEYFGGKGRGPVDAVVHFAAIPRIFLRPDNAMFAANVLSTYNVIEAATKFGIRKIITASSETVYGVCFAGGKRDFTSFPVEEDYDTDPTDSYGLSKVLGEKIARSFASRTGSDIYALRIGGVVEPQDYVRFPEFLADASNGGATAGHTWTHAIWARSCICASRGMVWDSRSSTPSTTTSLPTRQRQSFSRSMRPARQLRAPWTCSRGQSQIESCARSWGSGKNMIGERAQRVHDSATRPPP